MTGPGLWDDLIPQNRPPTLWDDLLTSTNPTPERPPPTGGFLRSMANLGINLWDDLGEIANDPRLMTDGIVNGIQGLMATGSGIFSDPKKAIPALAKGIVYDGLIKPVVGGIEAVFNTEFGGDGQLTPEEREQRYQEFVVNGLGVVLGFKAFKTLGKARLAGPAGDLARSKNALELVAKMTDAERAAVLSTQLGSGITSSPILRAAASVAAGGAPVGFILGETPEERFSNAVNYGIASAALGGAFGGLARLTGRSATLGARELQLAKDQVTAYNAARNIEAVGKALDPPDFAMLAMDAAEASFEPARVATLVRDKLKPGEFSIVSSVPRTVAEGPGLAKFVRPDGTADVLAFGKAEPGTLSLPRLTKLEQEQLATAVRALDPERTNIKITSNNDVFIPRADAAVQTIEDLMFALENLKLDPTKSPAQTQAAQKAAGRVATKIRTAFGEQEARAMESVQLQPAVIAQFQATGHFIGEMVDFGGKQYRINKFSADNKSVQLFDVAAKKSVRKMVKLSEVSRTPGIQNPLLSQAGTPVTRTDAEFFQLIDAEDAITIAQIVNERIDLNSDIVNAAAVNLATKGIKIDGSNLVDMRTGQKLGDVGKIDNLVATARQYQASPTGELIRTEGGDIAPVLANAKLGTTSKSRTEHMISRFSVSQFGSMFTTAEKYFKSVETLFPETEAYTRIFMPFQQQMRKVASQSNRYNKALNDLAQRRQQLFGNDLDEIISFGLETMSPDEVKAGFAKGRGMNADEIRWGEHLTTVEGGLDGLRKIFTVLSEARVKHGIKKIGEDLDKFLESAKTEFGLTDGQVKMAQFTAKMFEDADKFDLSEFSAYAPVRYAQSVLGEEVSLKDYLVKHGMTKPEQVKWFKDMRTWYDSVAPELKIAPQQQLNQYFPRILKRDPVSLQPYELGWERPDFDHALHRLGINDNYIRDPMYAAFSYLNSGMRKQLVTPLMNELEDFINKLGKGEASELTTVHPRSGRRIIMAADEVKAKMLTHLREAQHFTSPESSLEAAAYKQYVKKLGIDEQQGWNFSRRFLGLTSFSLMGFNPLMGIRDGASAIQVHYTLFGGKAARRMVELMNKSDSVWENAQARKAIGDDAFLEALKRGETFEDVLRYEGLNPGEIQRFKFEDTAVGGWQHGYEKIRDALGEKAFEFTLQRGVYERIHRAVFLERYSAVGEAYRNFVKHNDPKRFERELQLASYSEPVRAKFSQLINEGKVEQAAKLLAVDSGWQATAVYGLANHPIGWGTNMGRLFGQFGQWPLWAIQTVTGYSRNPAALARFGAATTGLVLAGAATNINFASWTMLPQNLVYMGGPAAEYFATGLSALGDPNSMDQNFALAKVARMLPINPTTGGVQLKQPYVPVPFQFWNVAEGLGLFHDIIPVSEAARETLLDNFYLRMARLSSLSISPWEQFGIPFTSVSLKINQQARDR